MSSPTLGSDALRGWKVKAFVPLLLVACNALGLSWTSWRIRCAALAAAYSLALTCALTYVRIVRAQDGRTLDVAAGAGQAPQATERLTFCQHDLRALRTLCNSVCVALVTSWLLHVSGWSSTAVCMQSLLLPLTAFDAEVVRLHLWREGEAKESLRRPFRSEAEKTAAAMGELRRVFETKKAR